MMTANEIRDSFKKFFELSKDESLEEGEFRPLTQEEIDNLVK